MFIYTLSDPNTFDVRYVGLTNDLDQRFRSHLSDVRKNRATTHKKNWIRSLLDQNKKPIIEPIEECDESEVEFWERWYISLFKSWGYKLVNATSGGERNKVYTQEVRDKIRNTLKGRKIPAEIIAKWPSRKGIPKLKLRGRKATQEERLKMSAAQKGRKHSEETKKKIGDAQRGCLSNTYGKKIPRERIEKGIATRKALGFIPQKRNFWIEHSDGRRKILTVWAKELGINRNSLKKMLIKHTIDEIEKGMYVGGKNGSPIGKYRKDNHWIECNDGRKMILSDWSRVLGIKRNTLYMRLKRGKPIDYIIKELSEKQC